jgi:hypothetical protein
MDVINKAAATEKNNKRTSPQTDPARKRCRIQDYAECE